MEKSRRVLLAVSSLTGGGAERVVTLWAGELAELGYEVAIFVLNRREREYPVSPKVTILSAAPTHEEYLALGYFQRFRVIRGILRTFSPDYVISFLYNAQLWMMLTSVGLGIRRVETLRINPWEMERSMGCISRILWRLCFGTSHAIILQTPSQAGWLSGRQRKKSVVIPNPVAAEYLQGEGCKVGPVVRNFVAAGRLCGQKNYGMMIEGFAAVAKSHPDLRLRIFGSGEKEYVHTLKEHICRLGMEQQITLEGRSLAMMEEYDRSDAFLMTSDYEGLPNALIEAMARGLVAISTDCLTGPADLIDNRVNGYLVASGDAEALARTIESVLEMTVEERGRMSQLARQKIGEFCAPERSVCKLQELMEGRRNQSYKKM